MSFLSGLMDLIQALRSNPITENWIKTLEEEGNMRKENFNALTLEVLEYEWHFLWRLHSNLKCKKILADIKRYLTTQIGYSSQTLVMRIWNSFRKLKSISLVKKRIRNMQSIYDETDEARQKILFYKKCKKKIAAKIPLMIRIIDFSKMIRSTTEFSNTRSIIGRAIAFDQDLCSPKFNHFFQQHPELIMPKDVKRDFIQTSTELDSVYLWDRLCLLEKIWHCKSDVFSEIKPLSGDWLEDRKSVGQIAISAFCRFVFPSAKTALFESFDGNDVKIKKQPYPFLPEEVYFTRKDCERYLEQVLCEIKMNLLNERAKTPPPSILGSVLKRWPTEEHRRLLSFRQNL